MEYFELNVKSCRICLDENIILNWNNELLEFCGMTFRDCYYKYTQLEMLALDPFSQMLCQNCSIHLKNSHSLVVKALESHAILQQAYPTDTQIKCTENQVIKEIMKSSKDIYESKHESEEFEIIILKQNGEPLGGANHYENEYKATGKKTLNYAIQEKRKRRVCKKPKWIDNNIYEVDIPKSSITSISSLSSQEELCNKSIQKNSIKIKPNRRAVAHTNISEDDINHSRDVSPSLVNSFDSSSQDVISETTIESKQRVSRKEDNTKEEMFSEVLKKRSNERHNQQSIKAELKTKKAPKINNNNRSDPHVIAKSLISQEEIDKSTSKKKPGMCSYCSKIVIGIASLKAHEETHKEYRERAFTCPLCGLKLFHKKSLSAHAENREKDYKCEFCDKAFFNRGALNIHRRIHLGQMIPCPLCSKEYFRQIDLDKHMNSHSATPINTDVKKRSRYFVYCKDCNKSMLSSSWKTHEARHKNEPLMKCSICDKDFFCRKSCVTHMKKVHHKTAREDYDKFIISCAKSRLSRLMLEQQEKIQPVP